MHSFSSLVAQCSVAWASRERASSFRSSSLALIISHRVVVWLHPLWRRIGISEWIRLWLCHSHTLTYSHIHIRIRMYSCAHISCLAAVCGLEYALVVPKSKPQLNRSTGSYNSNRHNTAATHTHSNNNKLGLRIWNHFICALKLYK